MNTDTTSTATTPATPKPRKTRQRQLIWDALRRQPDFRTAQQLHADLQDCGENASLATVYRVLQSLADAGEADTWRNPDGELAYRHCSPHHHHHLICRRCGRTIEIDGGPIEQWVSHIANSHGFTQPAHHIEINGLCPDCFNELDNR